MLSRSPYKGRHATNLDAVDEMFSPRMTVEQKIQSRVNLNHPKAKELPGRGKCWIWIAGKGGSGYGEISIKGKPTLAHRVSWEVKYGKIPKGLNVLHRCDNPLCVNPHHLFLGTQGDNVRDCFRKGRGNHIFTIPRPKGEAAPHAKLTEKIVLKVRSLYTGSHGQITKFAAQYGVTFEAMWRCINRRTWKHV